VKDTEIQINGMAHVILCVSDFGAARKFYERLLPALGMTPVCDTDNLFYCVGGRTAIGIQPADAGERFVQGRVGLHHLCLRARSREDIDRLHDLLREMGATVIHAPQDGTWAPGYYSVLFEDPDGIRLEANFVPGAGVLAAGVKFNPSEGYQSWSAILKRASAWRASGPWRNDDYDVFEDSVVVGRIMKVHAAPVGSPWMWTLAFGHHEDRMPTHGYEPTREAAMAAFAKSWRRE
jgi:catechol 2,3-dioxygenase-like lactoylglutathione lyase family enzyme